MDFGGDFVSGNFGGHFPAGKCWKIVVLIKGGEAMQLAKVGVRCRALPLQHIPVGPRVIAVGGSSGPRRGSGSSEGTEPLSHVRW